MNSGSLGKERFKDHFWAGRMHKKKIRFNHKISNKRKNMDVNYQPYYCYLKEGNLVVLKDKPDNFSELPFHCLTHCPNVEIATKTYQTNLKIMNWRSVEH